MSRARRTGRVLLWSVLVAALLTLAVMAISQRRWPAADAALEPPVIAPLPAFSLLDQRGRAVTLEDLSGSSWVADFIFTRCPGTCPRMTGEMKRLARGLPRGTLRVSITVDPDHDRPEVLSVYAASSGADEEGWLFLTGDREEVERLVREGFRLGLEPAPATAAEAHGPILHSTRFVLVDGEGGIRGYYDAFDDAERRRLLRDARTIAG